MLFVFMVLWFRFFDLVILLKPGVLLHKFTFSGTFLTSVLVFWRISRALFVLSLLVNSPLAELSLQNLSNKWGGGNRGSKPSTSHTLHSRPNAPVSLDFLPDLQPLCDCKIASAFRTLPPFRLSPTPLLPPTPVRSCQMFAFRRGESPRHRKRGHFHLLFAECSWQWEIGALHGKSQK